MVSSVRSGITDKHIAGSRSVVLQAAHSSNIEANANFDAAVVDFPSE
jgi:hypothetical protein